MTHDALYVAWFPLTTTTVPTSVHDLPFPGRVT